MLAGAAGTKRREEALRCLLLLRGFAGKGSGANVAKGDTLVPSRRKEVANAAKGEELANLDNQQSDTITLPGQAFVGDLRSTSGLGLGDGLTSHTAKWFDVSSSHNLVQGSKMHSFMCAAERNSCFAAGSARIRDVDHADGVHPGVGADQSARSGGRFLRKCVFIVVLLMLLQVCRRCSSQSRCCCRRESCSGMPGEPSFWSSLTTHPTSVDNTEEVLLLDRFCA